MIAKMSTSDSLYGTLSYNQQKVEDGEAHVLGVNEMWESLSGDYRLSDFASAFNMRLAANNHTKKPVVHISLNPDPKDVLTDEQLLAAGTEYMQRMGFGEQPYVIFKHEDIERHHIHIVTTNVKADGSKISDTYSHLRSKEITNSIETKYGLHPADVRQDNKVWQPEKVSLEKGRVRYQIKNIAKHLLDNYKFATPHEYRAALSLYNVELQEIKGVLSDNTTTFSGAIYSAVDNAGGRIATPIKASRLGRGYGLEDISKKIERNAEALRTANKESTKQILRACMAEAKSMDELRKMLAERGVDVVLRTNEAGRIYGATVVDHKTKIVLNGSKLGKEFAANAFQNLSEKWQQASPQQESENRANTELNEHHHSNDDEHHHSNSDEHDDSNSNSNEHDDSSSDDKHDDSNSDEHDDSGSDEHDDSSSDDERNDSSIRPRESYDTGGIASGLASLFDSLFVINDPPPKSSSKTEKKKRKKKRRTTL